MGDDELKKRKKEVFIGLLLWLLCIGIAISYMIAGVIYSVVPSFFFQGATVYDFNLTASNQLTTNISVNFASRFPYKHHGVNYHRLAVYATHGGYLITLPTRLPASYQDDKHDAVWSSLIRGNFVLGDQDRNLAMAVSKFQARKAGKLLVNVIIRGRITLHFWKFSSLWFGGEGCLYANCPAYLSFNSTGEYLEQSCRAYVIKLKYCD